MTMRPIVPASLTTRVSVVLLCLIGFYLSVVYPYMDHFHDSIIAIIIASTIIVYSTYLAGTARLGARPWRSVIWLLFFVGLAGFFLTLFLCSGHMSLFKHETKTSRVLVRSSNGYLLICFHQYPLGTSLNGMVTFEGSSCYRVGTTRTWYLKDDLPASLHGGTAGSIEQVAVSFSAGIPFAIATILGFAQCIRSRRNPKPDIACPICEYDLRQNESGICPECGQRLTVTNPHPGSPSAARPPGTATHEYR